MPDYTISVKFDAETKSYIANIENAQDATEEFNEETRQGGKDADGFGSKLKSLASKVSSLATAFGLFKAVSTGIEYNSTMEQYQTSFEVMTGSAEKAAETVEKLKKVAADTPFEMPQLADTTQLLMNYGFTADEAIDRMNMLGDISQGNADKMSRIAMAYGQMSSAGKVSLEDIKQMIEAGFNPLQEISESTGESMTSLYGRISDGAISVDEITASMQRSTSEGGKYFKSMEKQSETLSGKWSTLQDTFQNFLGEAVTPLSDFMRDSLIPVAIDVLENFEKYEPVFVLMGIAIGTVTALIVAYNIQQSLANANLTLWGAISGAATAVTTALGAAFTFLASPIGLVILAIGAVIAIGYLLINHWEEVKAFAIDAWNMIQTKFEEFDAFLTGIFTTDWTESFGAFGEILNAFFATVSGIWEGIKQTFQGIVDFVTGVFTGDWSLAWQGVIGIFSGLWNRLTSIVKAPINGVIGLINGAIDGINSISVDIPDWIPFVGGQHWGIDIGKIPYLLHGTDNWQGGFAYMNEGGRGELTYLPDGSQVIPHDISVKYAQEAARQNTASADVLDVSGLLDGMVIEIDNSVNVGDRTIRDDIANYTIRKMGNRYKAVLATKGGN